MKKLTAGIFTVMLGLVAVDASASITSKAYVDQQRDALAATVAAEVDRAKTAEEANAEAIANLGTSKQNVLTNAANGTDTIAISADGKISTTAAVATAQSVSDLKTVVEGLTGDGENGVAAQIADALTSYTNTEDMNSALALKADKATTYTKTEVDAAVAVATKAGTDAASALDAYKATNNTAVSKNTSDITALQAKDTEIEGKIGTVAAGKTVVGMIADAAAAAGDANTELEGRVDTIEKSAAYTSGITAAGVEQITTNKTDIAANKTAVEKAQADATQALNESIKKVTATGEDGTYVLTIKTIGEQATLKWEQIERAEAQ